MLNRIEINDFRSCRDVVLDGLGPMTVLVGRNAVGKTNILRAIDWAARSATARATDVTHKESGRVAIDATIDGSAYRYSIDFRPAKEPMDLRDALNGTSRYALLESLEVRDKAGVVQNLFDRQNEDVVLPLDRNITIGPFSPCMPALLSVLPPRSRSADLVRPFYAAFADLRYYPLLDDAGTEPSGPMISGEQYEAWQRSLAGDFDRNGGSLRESVLLRLLHLKLADDPRYAEIEHLLGANGLGVVNSIAVHPFDLSDDKEWPRSFMLLFEPADNSEEAPRRFNFTQLSSGTQRVIRIVVSLIFDQPAVMLLEHPEDGIHHALLHKLIGVLEAYSDLTQLIITSHSSVVFNSLNLPSVRLVRMENGLTRVRGLTDIEFFAGGKFLEEEGSLSDFIETVED